MHIFSENTIENIFSIWICLKCIVQTILVTSCFIIIKMYEQPQEMLKFSVTNKLSKPFAFASPSPSENRFPHNCRSSLSSPAPHLLPYSYLHLSFLSCPSFKQPPFSAVEIEQLSIVCFTKQHFSVTLVCDLAHNHGDLALLQGCCVFALFRTWPLLCGVLWDFTQLQWTVSVLSHPL